MSYILDALRKSDQQRQRGMTPTLNSAQIQAPSNPASSGKPALISYSLIAFALVSLGVTIGWLRPWQKEQALPANIAATQTPASVSIQAAPAMPAAKPEPDLPKPIELAVSPAPQPQAETPTAPPRQDLNPPTVKQPEKATASAPAANPVTKNQTPAPIQQELPHITITVHAYSTDPAERLAGINGRLLREGQEVAAGLRLERITEDGIILNFKGQRIRRNVR